MVSTAEEILGLSKELGFFLEKQKPIYSANPELAC